MKHNASATSWQRSQAFLRGHWNVPGRGKIIGDHSKTLRAIGVCHLYKATPPIEASSLSIRLSCDPALIVL